MHKPCAAYALLMVLIIASVSILVMAGALSRTYTESTINNRNNQYLANLNVAEAAVEKVYAKMTVDFQSTGLGLVTANVANGTYSSFTPATNESMYWTNFDFLNPTSGVAGSVYVGANGFLGTNALPSQYTNRVATSVSPIYRIVANVRCKTGLAPTMTTAVQEDVLLALVPISTYAIFYNGKLEFTKCATMTVNGDVHANGPIYTGAGSGATLTFNGDVSGTSFISTLFNDGINPPGATIFNGQKITNAPSVTLSMDMTNTYSLIQIPTNTTTTFANTYAGAQLLYNQANVIILISNTTVTTLLHVGSSGAVPGADLSGVTLTNTFSSISNNLNFLTLTNRFVDQRENDRIVYAAQIDLGKYQYWLTNNAQALSKFSAGNPPAILFVADTRDNTTTNFYAVRITNGVAPPSNGGVGFSLVTPNPLYVWGNYNCPNSTTAGSTNTGAEGTVPCALMSDALTLLSPAWQDSKSALAYDDGARPNAANIMVNAAILTGNVASTGTGSGQFSGGVHNLPRLLEDWAGGGGAKVTLNTSIINLFTSRVATNMFVDPGAGGYYSAPTRFFSFDPKFKNANQQPPGMPCAMVPIRYNWAQPPPNTVTYNVAP